MTKPVIGCWDDETEVVEVKGGVHRVRFKEYDEPSGLWFCNRCSGSFFQKARESDGLVCANCSDAGDGPLLILPVGVANPV